MSDEEWTPFECTGYDFAKGGYIVQRFDGVHTATFINEGEALFCVDAINAECRCKEHTGFGANQK